MWLQIVGLLVGTVIIVGGILIWNMSEPYWIDREKKRFNQTQT